MDRGKRSEFRTWLRQAWKAAVRTAEAMERTALDELFDRIDLGASWRRYGHSLPPEQCAVSCAGGTVQLPA